MFVVGRPGLIAAGTDLWTTAWSQPGYTQRDFDRWARIDDGIQMLVKVRYSDGGRNQYEVTRCFGFADNGNVHIKDYKQCEAQVQP